VIYACLKRLQRVIFQSTGRGIPAYTQSNEFWQQENRETPRRRQQGIKSVTHLGRQAGFVSADKKLASTFPLEHMFRGCDD
jgi:hypothetical protein